MGQKDINLDYNIMLENKVPLLIHDATWKSLFGHLSHKDIQQQKKILEDLVKEQILVESRKKRVIQEKRKLMAQILNLSHKVNEVKDHVSMEELEGCKSAIVEKNQTLEDLMFQSEVLPTQIRTANYNLLKTTIKYAYDDVKSHGQALEKINQVIETLREELRQLIKEKNDREEEQNATYSFLHGILGAGAMEKLDKDYLK